MSPRPFRIDVPQAVLTDLQRRLEATRFPEPLPGEPWQHGADVAYVRELCAYWRERYDWRKHEAELNRFPQFLCEVEGVDIHFWHVRGKGPSPLPLLLTHGWPGSIYEFHHLIEPLTNPAAHGGDARDAFDVIIPALPGYGFSGKPREPGWDATRVAAVFDRLMVEHLGYSRYGAQGGDWGGIITTALGVGHAEHRWASTSTSPLRRHRPDRSRASWRESMARRWRRSPPPRAATATCRAPSPCRSASGRRIHPRGSPRGSSRSSAPGAIVAGTSSAPSPRTGC
ncbi:epoxide hydrolase family protein [Cystobacter fuscus]